MPLTIITHSDFFNAHCTSRTETGEVHQEDRDRVSAIYAACCLGDRDDGGARLCRYLLDSLILRDENKWFSVPVDPIAMGMADYSSVVAAPIDLGSIRQRLDTDAELAVNEILEMIRRVFQNAMKYHGRSRNVVWEVAQGLLEWFDAQWDLLRSIQDRVRVMDDIGLAELKSACSVHSEEYIQCLEKLEGVCSDRVVCYSPLVMEHCSAFAEEKEQYFKDEKPAGSMTRFSKDTVPVVRRAMAAVIKSVEIVDNGERACIALVRPPGRLIEHCLHCSFNEIAR